MTTTTTEATQTIRCQGVCLDEWLAANPAPPECEPDAGDYCYDCYGAYCPGNAARAAHDQARANRPRTPAAPVPGTRSYDRGSGTWHHWHLTTGTA